MNTDLGRHSIRRRTIYAYSIAETAPGLVDHAHFSSTAQGYTSFGRYSRIRRYVGFTRARISDPRPILVDYGAYVEWLDALAQALDNPSTTPELFSRFANFTSPPDDRTPKNILLDIEDIASSFETAIPTEGGRPRQLELDELCYDIRDGVFTCVANSKAYKVSVNYDEGKRNYQLYSPELEAAYVRIGGAERARRNLVAYLSRSQSFRIVPGSPGIIYAHGHFYEPRLALGGRSSGEKLELTRIFHHVDVLGRIAGEKGGRCPADESGWAKGSLFHLIDTLGAGTELRTDFKGVDILVCDDLGTEVADFIAADTHSGLVVFIHAKVSGRPTKRSATALAAVCHQAVKNLDYIHPYSTREPPNLMKWEGAWEDPKHGRVARRIRKGSGSAQEIWATIREIVRDPSATRAVWILLGQAFSLEEFEKQRNRSRPAPEIVQILYQIQSTWGAVSSVGAKLTIFSSP